MSTLPYLFYVFYSFLYRRRIPIAPLFFMSINRFLFGAYIPPSCSIGKLAKFSYGGSGVVIHGRAIIGDSCIIGTCVTIGGRGKHSRGGDAPIIGNDVFIATGAKILGSVRVGNNVVIGANAVVIRDVPDNAVVAGVPAKIVGINKCKSDYY